MHSDKKNNIITTELFNLPNSCKENSHPLISCQSVNKQINLSPPQLCRAYYSSQLLLFPIYFQILNVELHVIFGVCFSNSVLDPANLNKKDRPKFLFDKT